MRLKSGGAGGTRTPTPFEAAAFKAVSSSSQSLLHSQVHYFTFFFREFNRHVPLMTIDAQKLNYVSGVFNSIREPAP